MRPLSLLVPVVLSVALLSAETPPVKMGLWEKKMTIIQGAGQPDTITVRSCITPETWDEGMAEAMKQRKDCTQNTVKNAHGYTFQVSCKMDQSTTLQVSGATTIADSEHIVSESHSTTTIDGKKKETTSRSASHFVSSNCGNVKPGEPETDEH